MGERAVKPENATRKYADLSPLFSSCDILCGFEGCNNEASLSELNLEYCESCYPPTRRRRFAEKRELKMTQQAARVPRSLSSLHKH
jgi:hypothetical protein